MNWREFIADMTGSLAWPTLVLALTFLFRAQVGRLIDRLRSARHRDTELLFSEGVEQGEELAKEANLPPAAELPEVEDTTAGLESLAQLDPRSAVIASWVVVERELRQLASRHGIAARTPPRQIEALYRDSVIDEPLRALLDDLRGLRNEAAHADLFDATPQATARYVQLAERVAGELRARYAAEG